MVTFPNAKINIGLQIPEKRSDGFHTIKSVFYPIGLKDSLELVKNGSQEGIELSSSGIPVGCEPKSNLCAKAYHLIGKDYPLPGVNVHLMKNIPVGAGLGGGSSDGAFFIRLLNEELELGLSWGEMHHYAKQLGSDCSFFVTNRPAFVEGKGDEMESISLNLNQYFLVLVCPPIHISTGEAYSRVKPEPTELDLETYLLENSPEAWRNVVVNDFEKSIFPLYPEIGLIKQKLYDNGALYASMSGSGSAVYGIYQKPVSLVSEFPACFVWEGALA
jgi:4-diphosphocytidyl-2-C-methyl-D-erythritol kinase